MIDIARQPKILHREPSSCCHISLSSFTNNPHRNRQRVSWLVSDLIKETENGLCQKDAVIVGVGQRLAASAMPLRLNIAGMASAYRKHHNRNCSGMRIALIQASRYIFRQVLRPSLQ